MSAAEPRDPSDGRLLRLTERLNPILVREVRQALNGKGFLFTAGLALLATVVIALVVAGRDERLPGEGEEVLLLALRVLAPILFFIVPFQAFQSTRSEVGGGTVEHLLMSRLSPGAIVRGKLYAATVQFGLYLAIFSPLIGLTYLLRGVDVPTIAVYLTLAFVYAVACSALGVACGALCRWRNFFRVVPFAILLIGLLWFTGTAIAGLEFVMRAMRSTMAMQVFLPWLAGLLLLPIAATALLALVGAAALSHPHENRSTPFRIYAFAFVLLGLGWAFYESGAGAFSLGSRTSRVQDLLSLASLVSAVVLGLFPLFATSETAELGPRARRRVPRRALLALLATPLLPGRSRGMLFCLLLAAGSVGAVHGLPALLGQPAASAQLFDQAYVAWCYVVLYAGAIGLVRCWLAPTPARNWAARGLLPLLLLLGVLLPLVVAAITPGRAVRSWNSLHVLNPFYTLAYLTIGGSGSARVDEILTLVPVLAAVLALLHVPAMVRGVVEVQRASRERRNRAP